MDKEDECKLLQIQTLLNGFLLSKNIIKEDEHNFIFLKTIDELKLKIFQLEEELSKEKRRADTLQVEINELKMDQAYGGEHLNEEENTETEEKDFNDTISDDEVIMRRSSDTIIKREKSFTTPKDPHEQDSPIQTLKKLTNSSTAISSLFKKEPLEEEKNEFSSNFESMMKKPLEVALFKNYVENIGYSNYFDFYETLNRHREMSEGVEKLELYSTLFCDYIVQKSTNALPISKKLRTECQELYNNDDAHCFDHVEVEVCDVLKGIHIQFKSSQIWREYAKANYKRSENAHFSDIYTVIEVLSTGVADTVDFEILKVQHKITGVIYSTKRLHMTTKECEIAFISVFLLPSHLSIYKNLNTTIW
jgi:hypothetical protein